MITIKEAPPPIINIEDGFSYELCDLVKDCLQKDVSKRPKYKKLLVC